MTAKSHSAWVSLCEGLGSSDPYLQGEAARLLGEAGDRRAVEPLLEFVSRSRYNTKTAGVEALRRLGDAAALVPLRPLIRNPNVQDDWYWIMCRSVRTSLALALLHWGDESGAEFLRSLADAGDVVFYTWYAPTVLRLPDDGATARELRARLTPDTLLGESGPAPRPTDSGQLVMVAEALALIGNDAASARLRALLGHHSRYVRGCALTGLLAVSADAKDEALATECLQADPTDFVKIKAALALARREREDGVSFLLEAASTVADPFDRAVSMDALGELRQPQHAGPVRAGLQHPNPCVRQNSLEALHRMGSEDWREAAARAMEDPIARVRLQAAACFLRSPEDAQSCHRPT